MSCIKIPLAIFGTFCWVYYGEEGKKKFDRVVKYEFNREPEEWHKGTVGRSRGGIIWVNEITNIPTLVHETNHFIDSLFDHKGLEDPTGELKSYLLSYITKYVIDKGRRSL